METVCIPGVWWYLPVTETGTWSNHHHYHFAGWNQPTDVYVKKNRKVKVADSTPTQNQVCVQYWVVKVPATGNLGHLCAHELKDSAGKRLIVGGVMAQLAPGTVPKCEQTSILHTHTQNHTREIQKQRASGQKTITKQMNMYDCIFNKSGDLIIPFYIISTFHLHFHHCRTVADKKTFQAKWQLGVEMHHTFVNAAVCSSPQLMYTTFWDLRNFIWQGTARSGKASNKVKVNVFLNKSSIKHYRLLNLHYYLRMRLVRSNERAVLSCIGFKV